MNLLDDPQITHRKPNTSDILCTFCKRFSEGCSWVQQRTRPRPGSGRSSLLFLTTTMRNALFGAMARETHNWTPQRYPDPRCVYHTPGILSQGETRWQTVAWLYDLVWIGPSVTQSNPTHLRTENPLAGTTVYRRVRKVLGGT